MNRFSIFPDRFLRRLVKGGYGKGWVVYKRSFLPILKPSGPDDGIKFPPKFCKTLTGRLPLEDGSVRPQTLGKRVSDDSQHFILRCRKIFVGNFFWWKFASKQIFVGKSTNCLFLRSYGFLDVIGRCASKSYPKSFDFQLSTTFGGGVKEIVSIFAPDFRPNWLQPFSFFGWKCYVLEVICTGRYH